MMGRGLSLPFVRELLTRREMHPTKKIIKFQARPWQRTLLDLCAIKVPVEPAGPRQNKQQ
jgi:hypothetical protein